MHPAVRASLLILPAFIAGLVSGSFGSRFQNQIQDSTTAHAEVAQLKAALEKTESQNTALQSQLARIVRVDLADYQRLQNEEAQFVKAKEILGKVFLVLFHNLLSDIPHDQLELAQALAASNQTPVTSNTAENPPSAPKTEPADSSSPQPPAAPPTPAKNDAAAAWVHVEKDFGHINPNKADAFLQAAVIPDILREQGDAQSFSSQDTRLKAMQGHYSGEVTYLDPKRKPSSLEMTLSSEVQDGGQRGEFSVRLVDENGVQSSMRGEGSIDQILKPVSPSKALIIRLYKTEFLQMYILENQGIILGNYYNEDKNGKVIHLGRFRLQRS
jgi:hypothetical protein